MIGGDRAAHEAAGHLPVLYNQVIDGLNVKADGRYLDGTFGRGGHAKGVLARLGPQGLLLVMDKDPEAIKVAQELQREDARVHVFHGSFKDMASWDIAREGVDGILLDLGVSSPQLDVAERGFSFSKDGPLDMRMDTTSGMSAAQWLAKASDTEIADVLFTYGEERQSRKIARAIVAERAKNEITRTAQLASIIAAVMPRGDSKIHPATRSFQAIRIFINRELEDLQDGLQAAVDVLKPEGRLAVISFHSLEDRITKQFFNKLAKAPPTDRRMPVAVEFTPTLKLLGGAQKGTDEEIKDNARARSAVLRVAQKVAA